MVPVLLKETIVGLQGNYTTKFTTQLLSELHVAHMGIVKTKTLASLICGGLLWTNKLNK